MPRYSDADRALAIATIERHDGSVDDALPTIRELLNAPRLARSAVYKWWQAQKDAPSTKQDAEKKAVQPVSPQWAEKTLDQYFEDVAKLYIARAAQKDAVMETKGKDAIMAAAIAVDKMRLLRDLPTEIIGILPGLVRAIEDAGYSPHQVLSQLKDRFDSVHQ